MRACAECLTRPALLRELAANIDRAVDRRAHRQARDLLALDDESLARALTFDAPVARAALAAARAAATGDLTGLISAAGCWSVCRHRGPSWPAGLDRLGGAAPRALIGRGDPGVLAALASEPAVTIVGARRAGSYGRAVADELGRMLGASGVVVISGMAFGIDSAVHRGSLEGGGRSLAVLAAGAERPYPRSRARLYAELVAGGAVISELPPATPTFRWMFPARNRLMAAMAGLTIVVEAAERSGSLITAEMAADIGVAVGAVPGPVDSWRSSGTNALLAEGASVIRGPQDALDHLLGAGIATVARVGPAIGPQEREVLAALGSGAMSVDGVVAAAGCSAGDASAALALLELNGYARADAAGRYAASGLSPPAAAPHTISG